MKRKTLKYTKQKPFIKLLEFFKCHSGSSSYKNLERKHALQYIRKNKKQF